MDFSQALNSLKNDMKLHRLAWDDGVYVKAMRSSHARGIILNKFN